MKKIETKFLDPSWHHLEELLCSAQEYLFISSPWISKEGNQFLQSIIRKLSAKEIRVIELWTRFDPVDYLFQTSDHAGLLSTLKLCRKTFSSRFDLQIWAHPKLHAKVYVVDKNKALVASSNLTRGGFMENIETAILIEGETKVSELFKLLRDDQKQMTRLTVEEIENFVNSLKEIDIAKKDAAQAIKFLSDSKVIPLGGEKKKRTPFYISLR